MKKPFYDYKKHGRLVKEYYDDKGNLHQEWVSPGHYNEPEPINPNDLKSINFLELKSSALLKGIYIILAHKAGDILKDREICNIKECLEVLGIKRNRKTIWNIEEKARNYEALFDESPEKLQIQWYRKELDKFRITAKNSNHPQLLRALKALLSM